MIKDFGIEYDWLVRQKLGNKGTEYDELLYDMILDFIICILEYNNLKPRH